MLYRSAGLKSDRLLDLRKICSIDCGKAHRRSLATSVWLGQADVDHPWPVPNSAQPARRSNRWNVLSGSDTGGEPNSLRIAD